MAEHNSVQAMKDAEREAEAHKRTSTSWKLDLLDAMSIDPRLKSSDFRVAYRLIQHRNAVTGLCNPSQETIADETGLKPRTIREAIKRLENAKWILVRRPNRSASNHYAFSVSNVNAMLDRITLMREARADERRERHLHAGPNQLERHCDAGPERHCDDAKHLRGTP